MGKTNYQNIEKWLNYLQARNQNATKIDKQINKIKSKVNTFTKFRSHLE